MRCKVTEIYANGKGDCRFFPFSKEESPFLHTIKYGSPNHKIPKPADKNNFRGSEIYFKGLEIDFKGTEIYFQATEKVLWHGVTILYTWEKGFVSSSLDTSQSVK